MTKERSKASNKRRQSMDKEQSKAFGTNIQIIKIKNQIKQKEKSRKKKTKKNNKLVDITESENSTNQTKQLSLTSIEFLLNENAVNSTNSKKTSGVIKTSDIQNALLELKSISDDRKSKVNKSGCDFSIFNSNSRKSSRIVKELVESIDIDISSEDEDSSGNDSSSENSISLLMKSAAIESFSTTKLDDESSKGSSNQLPCKSLGFISTSSEESIKLFEADFDTSQPKHSLKSESFILKTSDNPLNDGKSIKKRKNKKSQIEKNKQNDSNNSSNSNSCNAYSYNTKGLGNNKKLDSENLGRQDEIFDSSKKRDYKSKKEKKKSSNSRKSINIHTNKISEIQIESKLLTNEQDVLMKISDDGSRRKMSKEEKSKKKSHEKKGSNKKQLEEINSKEKDGQKKKSNRKNNNNKDRNDEDIKVETRVSSNSQINDQDPFQIDIENQKVKTSQKTKQSHELIDKKEKDDDKDNDNHGLKKYIFSVDPKLLNDLKSRHVYNLRSYLMRTNPTFKLLYKILNHYKAHKLDNFILFAARLAANYKTANLSELIDLKKDTFGLQMIANTQWSHVSNSRKVDPKLVFSYENDEHKNISLYMAPIIYLGFISFWIIDKMRLKSQYVIDEDKTKSQKFYDINKGSPFHEIWKTASNNKNLLYIKNMLSDENVKELNNFPFDEKSFTIILKLLKLDI